MSVTSFKQVPLPMAVKTVMPHSPSAGSLVEETRAAIEKMVRGEDKRFLVVVGPCSIHNPDAAREYATRLQKIRQECKKEMEIVMRVYFEKPRTTVGWMGFVEDPTLTGTPDYIHGIERARQLLLDIHDIGVPCATEIVDPMVYQYYDDLISWAAIGARTVESQIHRKIVSGLPMPVGFKNNTNGDVSVSINAITSAQESKTFLTTADNGDVGQVTTSGNPYTHVVLRGGLTGPNYTYETIMDTAELLRTNLLHDRILIDCNHGNSGKDYTAQPAVCQDVLESHKQGAPVLGLMIESNLDPGSQQLDPSHPESMAPGISVTDPCLGWTETETLLREMANILRTRFTSPTIS